MANTTVRVAMGTVPWGDDQIERGLAATATTYYPGAMIALDSSGYAVKCDNTSGITFDGINAESVRIQVMSGDAAGDRKVKVKRPWRFTATIASATASDVGRALYAAYDNEVSYSQTNSILVGWVDQVLSSTSVLVKPAYAPLTNLAVSSNTLTFAGSTGANTIVMPDNLADALSVKEGSNSYLTFITTNSGERVQLKKQTLLGDSIKLAFGDADDLCFAWDGTDLKVTQATANSAVEWGVSGAGIDHIFYGDTATYNLTWDQSADSLIFNDNAKLALGSSSDIVFLWDNTDLKVSQATTNSAIKWGVDGAGIDHVFYGDTASTSMTWDQSADTLLFTGATRILFTGTTGQPEMHLTDNLADALSVKIPSGNDLMVFTTTDSAESVAIRGLRTVQTTAVAITGATTLTLGDSGGIFTVSQAAAYDIDLPSPTSGPGCSYFFSLTGAAANNVTITVAGSAATFVGSITIDGATIVATGSTLTFASGASSLGDSIEVRSIATNLYHVRAFASGAGGITIA